MHILYSILGFIGVFVLYCIISNALDSLNQWMNNIESSLNRIVELLEDRDSEPLVDTYTDEFGLREQQNTDEIRTKSAPDINFL